MDVFERIAAHAHQMQDLRDDAGHAEIVTMYAKRLCALLKADERIVVPAAILHDIGYYGIAPGTLNALMTKKLTPEQERTVKEDHMRRGAMLARRVLDDIGYPFDLTKRIVDIVGRHDTDMPCDSVEEQVVRDADKLWRFSEKGVATAVRHRGCTLREWLATLKEKMAKRRYFQTSEGRVLAREEFVARKRELLDA